jgi:hypothetical protein
MSISMKSFIDSIPAYAAGEISYDELHARAANMTLQPSADGLAWEPVLELDAEEDQSYESYDVSLPDDLGEALRRWEHDLLRSISEATDEDFLSVCRQELLHVRRLQARHEAFFFNDDGSRRKGR